MTKRWERVSESLEQENLSRGVVHMIIAPNDMGDSHGHVIHHDGKVVGRRTIAPENDEVVEFRVVKNNLAFDQIVENGLSCLGASKSHRERSLWKRRLQITARAIIPGFTFFFEGLVPLALQRLRTAIAPVGLAFVEKRAGMTLIDIQPLRLKIGSFIPIQTEPPKALENSIHSLSRGTSHIRVLDSKDELPSVMMGKEPVEKRSPDTANVEIPRWAWRKTCSHLAVHDASHPPEDTHRVIARYLILVARNQSSPVCGWVHISIP
jgi:hypothetical protein